MIDEPSWLIEARRDIGQRETLGPNDSPWIRRMLERLGARWLLGQPWCGGAVAVWMQAIAIEIPTHWYRARAWATWGQPLERAVHGCVAVFARTGGGHVGLVVGQDSAGRLLVLGGNQGDAVNIRAFDRARLLALRWPPGRALPRYMELAQGSASASTSEA